MSLENQLSKLGKEQKKLGGQIERLRESAKNLGGDANSAWEEGNVFAPIIYSAAEKVTKLWLWQKEWKLKKLKKQEQEIERVFKDVKIYLEKPAGIELLDTTLKKLRRGFRNAQKDKSIDNSQRKELLQELDGEIRHLKKVREAVIEARQEESKKERVDGYYREYLGSGEKSGTVTPAQVTSLDKNLIQEPRQSAFDMLRGGARKLKEGASRGLHLRKQGTGQTQNHSVFKQNDRFGGPRGLI